MRARAYEHFGAIVFNDFTASRGVRLGGSSAPEDDGCQSDRPTT
jgi:hypothetical protein